MKSLTGRIAAVALGGVLAVGSLSGCGMFGSALDCGKLYSAANEIGSAGSDPAALKSALDELDKAAEGVDDEELKQAVTDITTETRKSVEVLENPESAATAETGDVEKINAGIKTIQEKCGG